MAGATASLTLPSPLKPAKRKGRSKSATDGRGDGVVSAEDSKEGEAG